MHARSARARVDADAGRLELRGLVGVVAEQRRPASTPSASSIWAADGVVALVLVVAERQVGLVGVEPVVLQGVGVELVVEADAASLLAQVQQVAAGVGDPLHRLAQLRPAVAALAAEDVTGQALAVQPDQRAVVGAGARGAGPVAERRARRARARRPGRRR